MKKVLWISRHKPLVAQLRALREKLGDGDIELVQHAQPIPTAEDAVRIIKQHGADVVVAVLPLSFMAHLSEAARREGFTLLRADMENIHLCSQDPCPEFNPDTDVVMVSKDLNDPEKTIRRHFRFRGFERLVKVELVTEPW